MDFEPRVTTSHGNKMIWHWLQFTYVYNEAQRKATANPVKAKFSYT